MRDRAHRLAAASPSVLIVLFGLLLGAACGDDATAVADGSPADQAPVLDAAPDGASCGQFSAGELAGKITALEETSGLAASRKNLGVLWIHNDAGDPPELFAIGETGALLAVYRLAGASATDWEDIAVGPGPGDASYIYVGDIGDNLAVRSSVRLLRVEEPVVRATSAAPATVELTGFETAELRYPGGAAYDAETLIVHPTRGEVVVATKSDEGLARFFVHRLPSGSIDGTRAELQQVATLRFGSGGISGGGKELTGGDVSPAGDLLLLRAERMAFAWAWPGASTLAEVLTATPCEVALQPEQQGEAIGFAADGQRFYTTSEGAAAPLFSYRRLDL